MGERSLAHFSTKHWVSVLDKSVVAEVSSSVIRQGIMRSVVVAWIKSTIKNSCHLPCSAGLRCGGSRRAWGDKEGENPLLLPCTPNWQLDVLHGVENTGLPLQWRGGLSTLF